MLYRSFNLLQQQMFLLRNRNVFAPLEKKNSYRQQNMFRCPYVATFLFSVQLTFNGENSKGKSFKRSLCHFEVNSIYMSCAQYNITLLSRSRVISYHSVILYLVQGKFKVSMLSLMTPLLPSIERIRCSRTIFYKRT